MRKHDRSAAERHRDRRAILIEEPDDLHAQAEQGSVTLSVVLFAKQVHPTVRFEGEPELRAVEVDDEAADDVLTAEVPSVHAAASQNLPKTDSVGVVSARCRLASQTFGGCARKERLAQARRRRRRPLRHLGPGSCSLSPDFGGKGWG
jgi:hypothetical protein